jgi:hypothetical protein
VILFSPCRTYLLARILQGKSLDEVEEGAQEMKVDYVSRQYLMYLAETVRPPEVFRPRDINHSESQEFLALHQLQGLVPRFSNESLRAFQLLQNPKARETIETLAVAQVSPELIVKTLADRKIRAEEEIVRLFLRLFWDLTNIDSLQLRTILNLRSPSTDGIERRVRTILAAGGDPSVEGDAPAPYRNATATPNDRETARQRRAGGNTGFLRSLKASQPLERRLEESLALKRAGYSDPKQVLASLPPSPLSFFLARSSLGLPLSRMDLQKCFEIIQTLLMLRLTEHIQSGHPEATMRASSTASTFRQVQQIVKDLGSADTDLRKSLSAIVLQTQQAGVYGDPQGLTQGHHNLNPYLVKDQEAAQEGVKAARAASFEQPARPKATRVTEGSNVE